ncbi:MAG: hypothetical protein WCL16_08645 [bacterium]
MAADVGNPASELTRHFRPLKPTVCLTYSVTYRMLALELCQMAEANLMVTEGVWQGERGDQPACLAVFRVDTPDKPGTSCRVVLHNSMTAVMATPDIKPLRYVKQIRESFRGVFSDTRTLLDESYSLEGDIPLFQHTDHIAGTVSTNLTGAGSNNDQRRSMLNLLGLFFGFGIPASGENEPTRVQLITEGAMVSYELRADTDQKQLTVMGHELKTRRVRARPMADGNGHGKAFTLWAADLSVVTKQAGLAGLLDDTRRNLNWQQAPVVTQTGLRIGSIRCTLIGVRLIPNGQAVALNLPPQ